MPTETDLLMLAAELDRTDSEARAYALSHDAELDACEYVREWASREAFAFAISEQEGN